MKKKKTAIRVEEAIEEIRKAKEKRSATLELMGLNLAGIPVEVFELTGLEGLSLSYNQGTELPKKTAELKRLWILDLIDNPLTQLPEKIAQLENLKDLRLDGDKNLIKKYLGNFSQIQNDI